MKKELPTIAEWTGWCLMFAGGFAVFYQDPNALSWFILAKLMWIHDDMSKE